MADRNQLPSKPPRNATAGYKRAEEYIPLYVCFLLENHAIQDYRIAKATARSLYTNEFKSVHNITKFSFSALFYFMKFFRIIKYQKQNDVLVFAMVFLDYMNDKNCTHTQNKFNVIPTQKSSKQKENLRTTVYYKSTCPTQSNAVKECSICNIQFPNDSMKVSHENSEIHKLRKKYLDIKENSSFVEETNLIIEIVNGKNESGNIVLRKNETKSIVLNVINKNKEQYSVLKLYEINPIPNITLTKNKLIFPCLIQEGTNFELVVLFKESRFYEYVLMFHFINMLTGKEIYILKNLLFHVHSSVVDDLHSIIPHTNCPKQVKFDAIEVIDMGEYPDKTNSNFNPLFQLPKYSLPSNMIVLINNNLEEFKGMTSQQVKLLKNIKEMFEVFKTDRLNKQNYYKFLELLLYLEEYQMMVDIRNYDRDNQILKRNSGSRLLELQVPGLAEHRPSVLHRDSVYIKESVDSTVKYEGIVHKIDQNSVYLGFSRKFLESVYINNKKFCVSFTFNRIPLRAEHQAIELISKHNCVHYFFPEKIEPKPLENLRLSWFNKNIGDNERQQQAVKHILSKTSRPYPYLIFGPPGTGKTVTIVEAVLQIWSLKKSEHILICTPSNSSADEIVKRLIKYVPSRDLLRYIALSYSFNSVHETVKPCVNYANGDFFHPSLEQILKYRIVITTLINACRLVNVGTPQNHFDYVFIDESGQATESETLVPIAGILTGTMYPNTLNGQIILVGDPEQLGPIIHSKRAIQYGFETSMLERLMLYNPIYQKTDKGIYREFAVTKLIKNYRSHPSILKLPNELFYHNELIAAAKENLTHVGVGWEYLPNKSFPILFHSVFGKDEQEGNSPSFFNVQECEVVVDYLKKLIGRRLSGMQITEDHIGIITPYHKQVYKLKQACNKMKWNKLQIGTVEKFQGQECLIIIVSTVRCNPEFVKHDRKFHLGFLQNRKRFNVTITRAKALLIMIGDPQILQYDKHWYAFIKYCQDNKSLIGTPFQLSNMDSIHESNISSNGDSAKDIDEVPSFARGNI